MPREKRVRISQPHARALDLPPPFRLVTLREVGDAFAHACANAAEFGAGTLVLVDRFDVAEFAVVLEPDEPLATARRAFYAGMVALADALSALAPPETPIAVDWPDAIHVDGGLVGGGRLSWPDGAAEQTVPDWLVFGATIRLVSMSGKEAGLHPLATALGDEGFCDIGAEHLVAGFSRHLMVAIDRWQEGGFAPIAAEYIARLKPGAGARRDLNDVGDLVVQRLGKAIDRRPLLPTLTVPSWLDPETGAPQL